MYCNCIAKCPLGLQDEKTNEFKYFINHIFKIKLKGILILLQISDFVQLAPALALTEGTTVVCSLACC